jgi:CBS domain-containing protein
MRVADLMTSDVAECSPEDSIRIAAMRMNQRRCGCLPVMANDGGRKRLVGIVTDRDLACRAIAQGLDPELTKVARCMSFPVHTIPHDADLWECADRFTTIGVRRLVVVDEQNRCRGIISRADLNRFVTDQTGPDPTRAAPIHDNSELTL